MKKIIFIIFVSLAIVSCRKYTYEPIAPAPTAQHTPADTTRPVITTVVTAIVPDSFIAADTHHYTYPLDSLKKWIYGHTYEVTYWNEDTKCRLDVSGKCSASSPNHVVWNTDATIFEYIYTESAPYNTNNYFNYGTYTLFDAGLVVAHTTSYSTMGFTLSGYSHPRSTTFSMSIPSIVTGPNTTSPNIRMDYKLLY